MTSCIWVLVNCPSLAEAKKIGEAVLDQRLIACYDIYPRALSCYFWPPKSDKKEQARGALLILETLKSKYTQVQLAVTQLHSDKLPFIGYLDIQGVNPKFTNWIKEEVK